MKAFLTYLMMFIYSAFTNRSLNEFNQQMNNHPVSTENNQSPLQIMLEQGMLENMHSGHTALSPDEIQDFGVDLYLGVQYQLKNKIARLMFYLQQLN